MLTWDLTIFGNTIGNKDRGEVIPRTWFHSFFSRKKSEIRIAFTFFEKWKVKNKIPSLFSEKWKWNWNGSRSRTRSENEKNSREFSRNKNLAGLCRRPVYFKSIVKWSCVFQSLLLVAAIIKKKFGKRLLRCKFTNGHEFQLYNVAQRNCVMSFVKISNCSELGTSARKANTSRAQKL